MQEALNDADLRDELTRDSLRGTCLLTVRRCSSNQRNTACLKSGLATTISSARFGQGFP